MLYVVATPIGNIRDITLRALEILQDVDLILAEDTRKTRGLLDRYKSALGKDFKAKLMRLDDHIQGERLGQIIDRIKTGARAALVSNAGTPQISDPGNLLIQTCVEAGIKVIPIPGPSALGAILSVANFAAEPVAFYGFLPKKKGRSTTLVNLRNSAVKYGLQAAVFYESPHRLGRTLKDLSDIFGIETKVVVGRELTKKFEEVWYGTLGEAISYFMRPKGEFVLLIKLF